MEKMREIIDLQMKLGEKNIEDIQFDPRSRDEIPKLLRGLQAIYLNKEIREQVIDALKEIIPDWIDLNNGRKGMDLWNILVLGTLRLNCNWDFDKLLEIANNHVKVRQMLGHSKDDEYQYALQTIKLDHQVFFKAKSYAAFLCFREGLGSNLPNFLPATCFDDGISLYISFFNSSIKSSSFRFGSSSVTIFRTSSRKHSILIWRIRLPTVHAARLFSMKAC